MHLMNLLVDDEMRKGVKCLFESLNSWIKLKQNKTKNSKYRTKSERKSHTFTVHHITFINSSSTD